MAKAPKPFTREERDVIKKAYRTKAKTCVIGGIEYKVSLQVKHPFVKQQDGSRKQITEKWLIAKRTDGQLVPLYSIEYTNNTRLS